MNASELSKPIPRRAGLPEWKKFWTERGFANKRRTSAFVEEGSPDVMKWIFQTGPYFMMVVDYRDMSFTHAKGVEQLLGFQPQDFYDGKFEFLLTLVHPDDREKVLGLAVHYYAFLDMQPPERRLDFKASINFRFRKSDGTYLRVLEQVVGLRRNEDGKVSHALKYFTDISHLKYSDEVFLGIFDDKAVDGQGFFSFDLEDKTKPITKSIFTAREIEILGLIAKGKTAKEIAASLHLSVFTVNKHRENMMKKTGSSNVNEVISFAYCNELL